MPAANFSSARVPFDRVWRRCALGAALCALLFPAAPARAQPAGDTLRLAGSNTIGEELGPALVRSFATSRLGLVNERVAVSPEPQQRRFTFSKPEAPSQLEVLIESRGTGTGFQALAGRRAEIAMASRPVTDQEETETVREPLRNAQGERVIGLDGVLVLVSGQNPLNRLTQEQIADIFAGRVTDWAQVGGRPGRIQVYRRDDASGTTDTFCNLVMQGCRGDNRFVATAQTFTSSEDLSDAVAADANGIGFAGFAYRRSAKALDIAGVCGLATTASEFTVKTEEYPLSRRLFLYAPASRQTLLVQQFLKFASTDALAQQAVRESGFINLDVAPAEPGYAANRAIADKPGLPVTRPAFTVYERTARAAQRLSVTLRFRTGSAELDSRATDDIERLVAERAAGHLGTGTIYLMGFTDNVGTWEDNLALARSRADAVAQVLRSRQVGPVVASAHAFLLPVACNDSDLGRQRNRRVEVWTARQ
ncbi:OmpA family protein [Rhodovastum atsumiense]|uniref:OmpA family protein n=1 Tax=Rhodovastum atsumiense TaxID=504468 RepID=A0A5M6IMK4_9PROT|nr:phosphate ABC transporter substrate-binding/OmpA family protein [Rhodovastum atsumiense]KAA5609462.1 OmpA family protein [Rhodovastum atsumiense]CAH2603546.1 OmpA family protein [Rhodovastum atsumiense]